MRLILATIFVLHRISGLVVRRQAMILYGTLLLIFSTISVAILNAEEPADEFLGELRKRGYHDTAIDYLDWATNSSIISDDWKRRIPFHRGVALIDSASNKSAEAAKTANTAAESLLTEFIAANDDLTESKVAKFWLGRILAEKARAELQTVTDDMTGPAMRKIRGPAAEKFVQAQEGFTAAIGYFQEELTAMKKLPPSQLDGAKRDRYRSYYLEAELNKALIDYELAETVATNKTKYRDQLKVAKESLGKLAVEQSKRLAGVQAKIYLGQCFEDLEDIEDALAIYQEVINEQALPELISSQAVLRSMACSAGAKSNPQEAIETGLNWIRIRSPKPTSVPGQAVRLEVARQINAIFANVDTSEQKKLGSNAKSILADAMKAGGAGRTEAAQLMASLGINAPAVARPASLDKATSFASAKAVGEQLRSEMQSSLTLEKLLISNLEKTNEPENRAELETQLSETRQELNSKRDAAIAAYRRALELTEDDDNPDDVNEVRYLVCYLYYTAESYYEAAVLGEYVCRQAAHLPSGKSSANIALASYVKLFQSVPAGQDNSAETNFLVRIATFISDTWPDAQEAQDSLSMLIGFMVNDGKIKRAESFLERIPPDSPKRAEAELRTGQAIWRSYLKQMQAATGEPVSGSQEMKQRAQALLLQGINRARGSSVTATTAQGALALSQIYVDVNSPDKATSLLNDPELGPLTLIGKDDAVAKSAGFLEQAYKTALRAQIGSLAQPNVDAKAAVGQAMGIMSALSQAVGDSPAGKRRLTATYISLAKDLQRQLQLSTADTRQDIAAAFESFLNQVAEGSSDVSVLNWVAETYFSLAEGEQSLSESSPKAKDYYGRSATVFGDLLAKQTTGAVQLEAAMVTQVRVRAAAANHKCGNYKQSFDLFEQVLVEKNNMLNVQMDAARAFQDAAALGNAEMFNSSIKGARPDQNSKKTIWGWEKISKVTAAQMTKGPEQRAKFGTLFFESRYNIARCRYQQGMLPGASDKASLLAAAKRAITITANLYPDLGGKAWQRKFDRLLREVQQNLGEAATGLQSS